MTSWSTIKRVAKEAGAKFPELVAAQWALESGYGDHTSGKNNYFGLKGTGTSLITKEWDGQKFIEIIQEFKDFNSLQECVYYLVEHWYKDYESYSGVNRATSIEECANLLTVEGYATDPAYSEKLMKLVNQYAESEKSIDDKFKGTLCRCAKYYGEEAHQVQAWNYLESLVAEQNLDKFLSMYRRPMKQKNQDQVEREEMFPLDVEYFYQRDSATGHGERSCQASSIAMAVEYLRPDVIYDDDEYLNIVFRYGDTVSQMAHKAALDGLGIKNQFRMNGTKQELLGLLDKGCPVPIGILHRGTSNAPSGGGHWITLIGYDDDNSFYVHDPFGKLRILEGGYSQIGPVDGKCQKYDMDLLMKRWLITSDNDGWLWDLSKNLN